MNHDLTEEEILKIKEVLRLKDFNGKFHGMNSHSPIGVDAKIFPDPSSISNMNSVPVRYYYQPLRAYPSIGFSLCEINDSICFRKISENEIDLDEGAIEPI
jgi:hypothetical protein